MKAPPSCIQVGGFVSLYLRFVGRGTVSVDYQMAVINADPAQSLVLSSTRRIELSADDTGAAPEMQFTGFSMLIPRDSLLSPDAGFQSQVNGTVAIGRAAPGRLGGPISL